ncbi:DEAD/DEAH box helicase [Pseudomonas sp. MMS21-TM103]|uniref:DEAD/DEAH box helicase n=2 Tax=Pseudomonas sp. MMS21 TM103 TaxID=2886506 RepID=UPI001EDEFF76|nr:DEAD/DEAH box helicase [Pseudomonas sp. MMS21 TM103]MCG4456014.1 DEAD/DEAH box helicase [Pseudomonas sp. MMS21 TM103]
MSAPVTPFGLAALPDAYKAVLYVLALSFPGKHKTALLEQLREMGVRSTSSRAMDGPALSEILAMLHRLDWVSLGGGGQPYCLPPERRNLVLQQLNSDVSKDSWLLALRSSIAPQRSAWDIPSQASQRLSLWLAILGGQTGDVRQGLALLQSSSLRQTLTGESPCQQLLADEPGRQVFATLKHEVKSLLLEDYLEQVNWQLQPADEAYRQGLALVADSSVSVELSLQLMLQALWRGDWLQFEALGQGGLAFMQQFIQLMLRGQYPQALLAMQEWLLAIKRQSKKRKVDLPPILNGFYCLLLLASADKQLYPALKQAVSLGLKEYYGRAYPALQMLVEQQQASGRRLDPGLSEPLSFSGFDGLLLALGLYWANAEVVREPVWREQVSGFRDNLAAADYHWLAEELDALLAQQFAQPRRRPGWHQAAGLVPLVSLYQRQEAWQHALTALSLLKPGKAESGIAQIQKSARLAWFVTFNPNQLSVEPREQKLGAKGWSKGRAVALKRLFEDADSLDFLLEQDRQTIRMIQPGTDFYYGGARYELSAEHALPRLVGHPALFWADAPDVRIDLLLGQISLQLKSQGTQIHLKLEPNGVQGNPGVLLRKETPTRLLVYPVSRELRQIADIVGDGLSVPQAAKAQLVEAISAIAPLLPIHSDLPELAGHLDSVAADSTLYAHLLPLEAGLRLQLLVRPLASSSWFKPGHGLENILGELDGKALQASRDLHAETAALQRVLQACPALAQADTDGQEWQLAEPQDALQVLSELQVLEGDWLQCVWPEGERMRIRARPGMGQLKLGLKQQGDWFVLSGEVQLDDGRVLHLRQLLELLKSSTGRFLKLGDQDWLALSDSLRKRLDELAHLADQVGDDGLRLNLLTTPLLAGLAQEAGEFQADAGWQAHLDKLESLKHYQPQVPSTLQAELRDYQREGFDWLARLAQWGVGACLADDMGLGKTVQTLALLLHRAPAGPQLVVAPTSVALNWQSETARFAPTLRLHIYQQNRHLAGLGPFDLVIVSYGLLQQDNQAFASQHWTSVVLDEAQAIKNSQSKRSQAAMTLQADFKLIASGTPVENHLGELWNLFRFINPGLLGSQDRFAQRFSTPIERGEQGARKALKALIQPFILRRLKSQVLDELPPRTEITYKVPLSSEERHLYEALRQQALTTLSTTAPGKSLQVLAEITRLRRFCCHPRLVMPGCGLSGSKLAAFAEIVEELLDNRHKALVFSQFVDHLSIIRGWLDEQGISYQYLDGATPPKERQTRMAAFQAGIGEIFLISLKAGGTGLNLTAADYVIHLDPWWNPAVEDQASDRAHRMGQQRPVTIYRLVTEHTIEEQIVALHGKKRDLADSLLGGGEVSGKLDADALLSLLKGDQVE